MLLNGLSIISNYPKPLFYSVGTAQIYSATRLFKLSYTIFIIITEDFQIKDDLYFHIWSKQNVQQMDQSINLTQNTSSINNFNSSQLILMINITCSRSLQDEILLIKFLNNSVIYSNEGYSQIETEVSCSIPKVTYIDDVTIAQQHLYSPLYWDNIWVSVLSGGVELFFNFLDTLQIFNQNMIILTILFLIHQHTTSIQFINLLSTFRIIFDLSGIIDQILNTQQLKKISTKVAGDNLISLFIIIAATIITVWISLFCIYAIAKMIQQIHTNYYSNDYQQAKPKILYSFKFNFFSQSETENFWLGKVGVYYLTINYIMSALLLFQNSFIVESYMLIWPLHMIYFQQKLNSSNFFIRFSSLLACFASTIYIFSIYQVIQLPQMKKYSLNNKAIKAKHGSIFNGIKINQFSKYLNTILLIKKLTYKFLLIFLYEFPNFQTISITLLSTSMGLFFIFFIPLKDQLEYFKQLFSEVMLNEKLQQHLFYVIEYYNNKM
ncbi:unnamed protein product [Paramecium pentaurelia]|uniref:Transmembrane protein n=1 Tax=Paramecium pentaurelia TaxID=43138 RepID=A0A8S1ULZ0_9CILI|nr:unnamed protein product [Paramecium pentaurelia]